MSDWSIRVRCEFVFDSDMPPNKKIKTVAESDQDVKSKAQPEADNFESDWRSRYNKIEDIYGYVLENKILTDVKLIVGEEQTAFSCHRLILALGSPVFQAMFFGDLAERNDTIIIPDVDPEGFEQLIKFLYTHQCAMTNDVIVFKTYFAADKYCVTQLKNQCEEFLSFYYITPSNVWLFYENALFLNSELIKKRCENLLKKELEPSLEHSCFLDINLCTMESFLNLDDLSISEEKILRHAIRWAEHQSQIEGANSFENILERILPNIRFGAFTSQEFVQLRHSTRLKEILSIDDTLLILEHLTNPLRHQLPVWCSKKQRYCEPDLPERQDIPLTLIPRRNKRMIKSDNHKKDFDFPTFNYSRSSVSVSSMSFVTSTSSDSDSSFSSD